MTTPNGTVRSLAVASWLVAGLAIVAALYFARTLFIPMTLACVLALVLAPVVRLLCRLGLPRAMASALVVISAIAVTGAILVRLSAPAAERSDEHTAELQSLMRSSYAALRLKQKN